MMDISSEETEQIARAVCKLKNIDPDGKGHAVTPETERLLGKTYPLWKYQIAEVELILSLATD